MNGLPHVRRKHLILAVLLAGAAGLTLVVLGWWIVDWQARSDGDRVGDPSWWAGGLARLAGYLSLSKVGFKLALVAVLGTVAAVAWMRSRRDRQESAVPGPPARTGPDDDGPPRAPTG
ncbi:hypothetical protein [Jidongwangia harbinensis]|uniref:hypothetical protein n=1 Tax=Jidongwangia harbinensis TaxID=2878561 RepID=UPI001CD94DEC|nr:hypothetical protein [Jidongwangia harbinensis]MCA2214165.1 hypothetical protein [Jidongwangia harbinensis]